MYTSEFTSSWVYKGKMEVSLIRFFYMVHFTENVLQVVLRLHRIIIDREEGRSRGIKQNGQGRHVDEQKRLTNTVEDRSVIKMS